MPPESEPSTDERKQSWPALVRQHLRNAADYKAALFEATVAGGSAWHVFLDLDPEQSVLVLNAGTGLAAALIAPLVSEVIAAGFDDDALALARDRFAASNDLDNASALLLQDDGRLPFPDRSFDCIVFLDVESRPTTRAALFADAGRVLRPGGQMFVTTANRYSLAPIGDDDGQRPRRRDGLSYDGCRRLLRRTGLESLRFFSLVQSADFLARIDPLDSADSGWKPQPPVNWKQRIKTNKRAVHRYGILAAATPATGSGLLDGVLADAAALLSPRGERQPLTLRTFHVSRKDKLILRTSAGSSDAFVRLPLTPAALASESRNAEALRALTDEQRAPVRAPMALADGEYRGRRYYVESVAPGAPIGPAIRAGRLETFIGQIEDLLDQLNPHSDRASLGSLDGQLYEREVVTPLETLAAVIPDERDRTGLAAYFADRLRGATLAFGQSHGDFSVSNIFHADGEICGLIDWESARQDGMPIIDAINFVESVDRLKSGELVGATIPRLARGGFNSAVERDFVFARYERLSIDARLHEPLVYLKWLHHMAYLMDFWLPYSEPAAARFVTPVVTAILGR